MSSPPSPAKRPAPVPADGGSVKKKRPGRPPRAKKGDEDDDAPVRIIQHDDAFNAKLFELLIYRSAHGHLHVGATDAAHQGLFQWVQQLRLQYKLYQKDPEDSTLTEDQIKVLESLQFHFHTRGEEHWKIYFAKMKQFYEEHGHCMVPRESPDHKLGDWVTEQRRQFKYMKEGKPTTLTNERKKQLDELEFVWQVRHRTAWNDSYDKLVKYKEEHGDCLVPQHYKNDKSLGKWVAKQREQYRFYKQGKHSFLTPDRRESLEGIGFVWSVRESKLAKEQQASVKDETAGLSAETVAAAESIVGAAVAAAPGPAPHVEI